MEDWTAGYVADVDYTYGCYVELNPLRLKLAFLNAGVAYPEIGTACELGFGQGLSVNIHAAASVTSWYGTDFNPSQALFAQELAAAAGSGAKLFDQAFADFCSRTDLPDFDYIGIHGIWSWISDENRKVMVDFIRRKLKLGGVLYISYNTQPGWAAMVPMRDLMTEYSDVMATAGHGIVSRIDEALAFAEKLFAAKPGYARANPHVEERVRKLKDHSRSYLAHEYFNRDWHPMPFSRMAEWLAPGKLSYVCSAHYNDHILPISLTAEQQALLLEIPDTMFRETVRDFCMNQQFRRDYWVKGTRKLNALEQAELLRSQRFVLAQCRSDVTLKVASVLGEATMQEEVYNPILDLLADNQPKSLGEIEQALKEQNITFMKLLQAVILLVGNATLYAVQDAETGSKAKPQTDALNAYLVDKARGRSDLNYLASPVTGGGVPVSRFHQLFLLAITQGKKQPADWAQFVWELLAAQGQRVVKEGVVLETFEENLAELTVQALEFAEKRLPVLKALGII